MTEPTADVDGLNGLDRSAFRTAVLDWYDRQGRSLSFRGPTDPYLVLVSETILQQTQVSRGGPAWTAFSARFPTVHALAAASPADVLRAWRGLGYNRRAINLRRAARIVVSDLGGEFPRDVAGLERLPGVGPYTARAVASIAYGLPVGAVDTNVRRVIGRVVAGDPAAVPARDLQALADALATPDRSADWTHALMDLGATLCRPQRPHCDECPVRGVCRYGLAVAQPADARATTARTRTTRPTVVRERAAPFTSSRRWLRGRILDRLRDADDGAWTSFDGPVGVHDQTAVSDALRALARDGLVDLAPGLEPLRARLPTA
jgi:A/G-specific adenine glycosylase